MKEKFTKIPTLFIRSDKSSPEDALRILTLTIFLPIYAVISSICIAFGGLWIGDYFPTLSYFLDDFLPLLMVAIPYIAIVLLLVKSFFHWKSYLHIQIWGYGIIALLYCALLTLSDHDGFGFAFLLMYGLAFLAIFVVQFIVIGIRELIRKIIKDRTKERQLGLGLLAASILTVVVIFLCQPTHYSIGKELNKVCQAPGEIQLVDNYLGNPTVEQIPEEKWAEILSTIEVDTPIKQEYCSTLGDLTFAVSIYTAEHPDREIRILWWDRDNQIEILYRGAYYYADGTEFRKLVAPYYSSQE